MPERTAYLLDLNVISEVVRPAPSAPVLSWMASLRSTEAFLSVLTLGEIARGVHLMRDGRRRTELSAWLERDLRARFRGRILPVDEAVALAWGRLDAEGKRAGRPLPLVDGLLLATAEAYGLTLATRNVADCGGRGVRVFSPWEAGG